VETQEVTNELKAKFYQKRNAVIQAVAGILKTGKNTQQNYGYAEEREVVVHIRKAFTDNNLAFDAKSTGVKEAHDIATRSGSMKCYLVELEITLIDTETGYSESGPWHGLAADSGDKALQKAYTSGIKYYLMKNFLLPTGDDIESFNPEGNGNGDKPKGNSILGIDGIPEPTEEENAIINQIWEKLVDSTPEGLKLSLPLLVESMFKINHNKHVTDKKRVDPIIKYYLTRMDSICTKPETKSSTEDLF
jgi:hypothetical protein